MAHARRRFVDAFAMDGAAAIVQQLYQVERTAAAVTPDARRALRQEHALPLLAQLKAERDRLAQTALPKSPVGDAVRYLANQWDGLRRFVEVGRLAVDNNAIYAARGISAECRVPEYAASTYGHVRRAGSRLCGVGRKNHYGSKSLTGTQVAALFSTLSKSAKLGASTRTRT